MHLPGSSLIDVSDLSLASIESILETAIQFESKGFPSLEGKSLFQIFMEPSTRTALSFEMAASKLGMKTLKMDSQSSSIAKGESLLDCMLTAEALGAQVISVRHSMNSGLKELAKQVNVPIINAGEGLNNHPTQALLDALTIRQSYPQFEGLKIVFVGDVRHSRVVSSDLDLFTLLGAQCAQATPLSFRRTDKRLRTFENLQEALQWCDVCMTLRVQFERHVSEDKTLVQDFQENYQLNSNSINWLSDKALLLHPGPINRGVEIEGDILSDHRVKILQQVRNGVNIRASVLWHLLGGVNG